jgi:hypothetical protein
MAKGIAVSATRNRQPQPIHHSSHRRLLATGPATRTTTRVDAVIVPAARAASGLAAAADLADGLGAELVVLCSRDVRAADVKARRRADQHVWAADIGGPNNVIPRFRSTMVLRGTPFHRRPDTPLKRNIGLALTRMTGWERVLFFDDDIDDVKPGELGEAAALLDDHEVVGLTNTGFPDNSVVCHANRATGHRQDAFIGAGAMLFHRSRAATAFFPAVYNEDWFFLLDDDGLASCAAHGEFAQREYDPFADPRRAAQEEFGDCLAEGIFTLLDSGRPITAADDLYWRVFLDARAALIERISTDLTASDVPRHRRAKIAAALDAATCSLDLIKPSLCTRYLAAWHYDLTLWRRFTAGLPQGLTTRAALAYLGLIAA